MRQSQNTSSLCSMCGERLTPNGHRLLMCPQCGYENDRDVTACLNILRIGGLYCP
ncbi:MAG: zinc ribbon domain-containing protein [Archaeoglobaceae archaeon]